MQRILDAGGGAFPASLYNLTMPLKTKRWNDPAEKDDGYRLLICRYRPRGVKKQDETWDGWCSELAPSRQLHGDYYGKNGPPISWDTYRRRYLREMEAQTEFIDELAQMLGAETETTRASAREMLEEVAVAKGKT